MASGLLLGVLVGGPGLFSSYSASARATCTPRTAFVSSDLDLVKGYNSGAADTECKVTFTNGLQTRGVGEVGQCASSGDVLSSRFVNGDEIFFRQSRRNGHFRPSSGTQSSRHYAVNVALSRLILCVFSRSTRSTQGFSKFLFCGAVIFSEISSVSREQEQQEEQHVQG